MLEWLKDKTGLGAPTIPLPPDRDAYTAPNTDGNALHRWDEMPLARPTVPTAFQPIPSHPDDDRLSRARAADAPDRTLDGVVVGALGKEVIHLTGTLKTASAAFSGDGDPPGGVPSGLARRRARRGRSGRHHRSGGEGGHARRVPRMGGDAGLERQRWQRTRRSWWLHAGGVPPWRRLWRTRRLAAEAATSTPPAAARRGPAVHSRRTSARPTRRRSARELSKTAARALVADLSGEGLAHDAHRVHQDGSHPSGGIAQWDPTRAAASRGSSASSAWEMDVAGQTPCCHLGVPQQETVRSPPRQRWRATIRAR